MGASAGAGAASGAVVVVSCFMGLATESLDCDCGVSWAKAGVDRTRAELRASAARTQFFMMRYNLSRALVDPAITIRIFLTHVNFELSSRAAQLPVLVAGEYRSADPGLESTAAQDQIAGDEAADAGNGFRGTLARANRKIRLNQYHRADNHDEVLSLDRNQETEQHGLIRKQHAVSDQQAKNGTRRPNYWDVCSAEKVSSDDDQNAGRDATAEIKAHEARGAPGALQLGTEHPQGQHVPDDMEEAAVDEEIGDELPNGEAGDDAGWNEREIAEQGEFRPAGGENNAENGDADGGNEQPFYAARQPIGRNVPVRIRTRAEGHRLGYSSRREYQKEWCRSFVNERLFF